MSEKWRLSPTVVLDHGAVSPVEISGYVLRENTNHALFWVSARNSQLQETVERLAELLGKAVPDPGAFVEGHSGYAAFWFGPEQWMIVADREAEERLAKELRSRLTVSSSVVEQSDGWICLDISGDDLPTMFERLLMADLHDFTRGSAIRGTIGHIDCFVLCLERDVRYRIFAARSFGRSLHQTLSEMLKSTLALKTLKLET